jgi:hypothetical protein
MKTTCYECRVSERERGVEATCADESQKAARSNTQSLKLYEYFTSRSLSPSFSRAKMYYVGLVTPPPQLLNLVLERTMLK